MAVFQNPLKAKLADGKCLLGIWSVLPSALLTELFGYSGFDFQILDMEHGTYDLGSVADGIRAAEGAGCSPLVRVPGRNPFVIQPVLDAGAHGVVVPQVQSAADAREIVAQMLFAPEGTRGYNPFTRVSQYSPPAALPAGKLDNAFPFLCLIIETENAFAEIDQILAIPRLDGIYLGVYDLSMALGLNGNTKHPQIQQIVGESIRKAKQFKKSIGLMVRNSEEMGTAVSAGADMLLVGVDSALIHSSASSTVQAFRKLDDLRRET
jgi:4-hydroxy-2-oxoheptanedioate aldolase